MSSWVCDSCKLQSTSADNLAVHKMRVHGAPPPFACPHCDARFTRRPLLTSHRRDIHGDTDRVNSAKNKTLLAPDGTAVSVVYADGDGGRLKCLAADCASVLAHVAALEKHLFSVHDWNHLGAHACPIPGHCTQRFFYPKDAAKHAECTSAAPSSAAGAAPEAPTRTTIVGPDGVVIHLAEVGGSSEQTTSALCCPCCVADGGAEARSHAMYNPQSVSAAFTTKQNLLKHLVRFHAAWAPLGTLCEACATRIPTKYLDAHKLACTGVPRLTSRGTTDPDAALRCRYCTAVFAGERAMQQRCHHEQRSHVDEYVPRKRHGPRLKKAGPKNLHKQRRDAAAAAVTGVKRWVCAWCSKAFADSSAVGKHRQSCPRRVDAGVTHPCGVPGCDYVGGSAPALRSHNKKHLPVAEPPELLTCPVMGCAYTTTAASKLASHGLSHSDVRTFACSACPYASKTKGDLMKHMAAHTETRDFVCQEEGCDQAFASRAYLYAHILKVHGAMRYPCVYCPAQFRVRAVLAGHERAKHALNLVMKCAACAALPREEGRAVTFTCVHTAYPEYICETCNIPFLTANGLQSHRRQHAQVYVYGKSEGERDIYRLLKDGRWPFVTEFCIGDRLRFDFFVNFRGRGVLIEYDGAHHFQPGCWYGQRNDDIVAFLGQVQRDLKKSRKARAFGFALVRCTNSSYANGTLVDTITEAAERDVPPLDFVDYVAPRTFTCSLARDVVADEAGHLCIAESGMLCDEALALVLPCLRLLSASPANMPSLETVIAYGAV